MPSNGPGFGVPIPVDEVWGTLSDGVTYGKLPPPNPKCGTGVFASLPVDYDCNGIADSCEGQYTNPIGGHLDPSADNEPGYTANSPKGDGWSVHDEYRGVHYVLDDGTTVKWASTDPVNKLDIFFWDAGFTPPSTGAGRSLAANLSVYTQALRSILCLQGTYDQMGFGSVFPLPPAVGVPSESPSTAPNSMAGYNYCSGGINEYNPTQGPGSAPNPLRFWYRHVNAQQAGARDPLDPKRGVIWFNQNSLTSDDTQGSHTVMILYSQPHVANSGEIAGTTNNLAVCPDCTKPQLARIGVDFVNISTFARSFGNRGAPVMTAPTWTAQAIAHEAGHWFQQNHAVRPDCCTFVSGGKASTLDWHSYTTQNNGNTVLVGVGQYPNGSRQITPVDKLACGDTGGQTQPITVVKGLAPDPNMPVYSLDFPRTQDSSVKMQNLQYELMDWTPNVTLADSTQWHFDPSNLNALCAMNPCPNQWAGPTLCKQ